jgi:hypothetical protein
MQKKQILLGIFLVFLGMMLATPSYIFGNEVKTPPSQERFSRAELNQMLAPIALYPDSLLDQMLMAAKYPREVAAADRWIKENQNLKGGALDAALKNKNWRVSVMSLVHYPRVLSMMGEKIEWTTRLGHAFLSQKNDVMDTIQELRDEAEESARNSRPPTPPAPEVGYGYGPYPYPPPPPVYPVRLTPVNVSPSFPSILCDLIFLRPAGVAVLGLGLAATVVAAPFALPTGSMGQVSQNLIGGPFNFTFVRPLGTWQTWEVSPPGR